MDPGLTIAIPAFNAARRIGLPLDALARQVGAAGPVELLIVDNNSTDGTVDAALASPAVDELRTRGWPVRAVHEPRQGLTHARIRAVTEARGDVVCFLDDDTVPCGDYVATGARLFRDQPALGLLVSRVRPRYEERPRPSIARRAHLLAINEGLGDRPISWAPGPTIVPTIGAGLWVRRDAFLTAVPWYDPGRLLSDRVGSALNSGGDIELGLLIGAAGYERRYDPGLELEHVIPAGRVRPAYVSRLIEGVVRSSAALERRYVHGAVGDHLARGRAIVELCGALVSAPWILARPDGVQELRFVLTARWAGARGPL